MAKTGPKDYSNKLLRLWWENSYDNEMRAISFSEIIERAEANPQLHFKKRTTINYLNELVEQGVLVKQNGSDRKTYYTPVSETVIFSEIAKHSLERIETPELVSFLTYFLNCLSVSDPSIELEKRIEEAKRHALAIINAKNQWNSAAKEIGYDTSKYDRESLLRAAKILNEKQY
jgi:predicted transcriptional regulator